MTSFSHNARLFARYSGVEEEMLGKHLVALPGFEEPGGEFVGRHEPHCTLRAVHQGLEFHDCPGNKQIRAKPPSFGKSTPSSSFSTARRVTMPPDRSTRDLNNRASSAAVVPRHEGWNTLTLRRKVQCSHLLPAASLQTLGNVSAWVRASLDHEGP